MIKRNMIKIFRGLKYDKTQYDKHFGFFYHIAFAKYYKKKLPGTKKKPKALDPFPCI